MREHVVRRFRVGYLRDEPMPHVGQRVVFAPERVTEEWDTATGAERSFVPRRVADHAPRVGIVRRIEPQRRSVIAEDEAARSTEVGAILSVTGTRLLVTPDRVLALLDYLAGTRLATDDQRLTVAHEAAPWLRNLFPDLSRRREIPKYATAAQYEAWLEGYTSAVGTHRTVPPCPIEFVLPPALNVRPAVVRQDAVDRLWSGGRAN